MEKKQPLIVDEEQRCTITDIIEESNEFDCRYEDDGENDPVGRSPVSPHQHQRPIVSDDEVKSPHIGLTERAGIIETYPHPDLGPQTSSLLRYEEPPEQLQEGVIPELPPSQKTADEPQSYGEFEDILPLVDEFISGNGNLENYIHNNPDFKKFQVYIETPSDDSNLTGPDPKRRSSAGRRTYPDDGDCATDQISTRVPSEPAISNPTRFPEEKTSSGTQAAGICKNGLPSSSTAIDPTITTAPHQSNIHGKVERYQIKFMNQFPNQRFRYPGKDGVKGGNFCKREKYKDVQLRIRCKPNTHMHLRAVATNQDGQQVDTNFLKIAEQQRNWKMGEDGTVSRKFHAPEAENILQFPKLHIFRVSNQRRQSEKSSNNTCITIELYVDDILVAKDTSNVITDLKTIKRSWRMEPKESRVNDCPIVMIEHHCISENQISSVDISSNDVEGLEGKIISESGSKITFYMPKYPNTKGGNAFVNLKAITGKILCSLDYKFKPDEVHSAISRKRSLNWSTYDVDMDRDDSNDEGPTAKALLRDKLLRKQ